MIIRSYVRVFQLDRRMYSFGDWQLPVPNGIPLRGFVYFVSLVLLSLFVWRLPLVGLLYGVFPWPVRHVILPFWLAFLGMAVNPDGRRADLFVWTWLCLLARRVRTRARRESMDWGGKLRVKWDASDVVLHRGGRIHGPACAEFRVPISIEERWDGRYAEGMGWSGDRLVYDVAPGETLRVRP